MGNMTLEQVNDMYLDVLCVKYCLSEQEMPFSHCKYACMKIDIDIPSID